VATKLLDKHREKVETFVNVCCALSDNKYVTSCGGNLAWKLDDRTILITSTCLRKGDHQPEDAVFVDPDGKTLEGKNRPTGELPIYLKFFRDRPDIRSVIHCHPACCSAFAVADADNLLMRPVFPEIILEIGPVPLVPYATPLTEELASQFNPYLQKYNAFLMENHGLILTAPKGVDWAYNLVEELETAADSLIRAQSLGPVKSISKPRLKELEDTIKIRGLPYPGAPGANASLMDLYYPAKSGKGSK
jgi:L-fuculose-phosphate aldolase